MAPLGASNVGGAGGEGVDGDGSDFICELYSRRPSDMQRPHGLERSDNEAARLLVDWPC